MEFLRKIGVLLLTTGIIWLCVALAVALDAGAVVRAASVILGLISTMTIWSMWALDQYGINVDGVPREKAKRDAGSEEDARLALLLSMLTPDQRDVLRSQLVDDLDADGEAVSLAELLAEQEQVSSVEQEPGHLYTEG